MKDLPVDISQRLKTLNLQLVDSIAEANAASQKLNVHCIFGDNFNKPQATLMRETSDSFIRTGSILRRMCDLMEPFLDEV